MNVQFSQSVYFAYYCILKFIHHQMSQFSFKNSHYTIHINKLKQYSKDRQSGRSGECCVTFCVAAATRLSVAHTQKNSIILYFSVYGHVPRSRPLLVSVVPRRKRLGSLD